MVDENALQMHDIFGCLSSVGSLILFCTHNVYYSCFGRLFSLYVPIVPLPHPVELWDLPIWLISDSISRYLCPAGSFRLRFSLERYYYNTHWEIYGYNQSTKSNYHGLQCLTIDVTIQTSFPPSTNFTLLLIFWRRMPLVQLLKLTCMTFLFRPLFKILMNSTTIIFQQTIYLQPLHHQKNIQKRPFNKT